MDKAKFKTVDEYILQFPADVQRLLLKLRRVIKEAAPEAEEKISYQIPTFYLYGNLVHFAAYKKHIGFYPAPSGMEAFKNELSVYKNAKGSVQFPINGQIPFELIKKIVRFRVKENKGNLIYFRRAVMDKEQNNISPEISEQLLKTLKTRFENNMVRHKDIVWKDVENRIIENNEKLRSLFEMERTGGEPDVVSLDNKVENFIFFDCSEESPKWRRSLCYDFEAQDSRKKNKPENNIIDMAEAMGIELLTEKQYRLLQKFGKFDTKTSSWIKTPDNIRKLGGAIFGDRRYDTVFIYHNGAESYYSGRGFRGSLNV